MQLLKVIIPGDYWDVHIYRGKLHLWTMSGSILTLDWDRLIDNLTESAISPAALRIGLTRGSSLYGSQVEPLRAEPEFLDWFLPRFDAQAAQPLTVDSGDINGACIAEQDNPFGELSTEVYRQTLYGDGQRTLGRGRTDEVPGEHAAREAPRRHPVDPRSQ